MKAIFFDRDGVLLKLVNGRAALCRDEVELCFGIEKLKDLNEYFLFVVSNQPDARKGNVTFQNFHDVHQEFDAQLKRIGIYIKRYYYCYHLKEDKCFCRKPKHLSLLMAKYIYRINLKESWMIGDRYTDIECGRNAGTKTIQISDDLNLARAIEMILND